MLTSFSEFKFFQSYRIPVGNSEDLRFLVDSPLEGEEYILDAKLVDVSVTGLGFSTKAKISKGQMLGISMQFKRTNLSMTGTVVRAFSNSIDDEVMIYGVEFEEDKTVRKFLENYVLSFSPERLRDCLIQSALRERYTKASEGFEIFSLLLSLFKDITHFADKEGFVESMLVEVVRILNAQRATIFLINPTTNELEAYAALGVKKDQLKFDYRLGIAGSVFTTGVALNIDVVNDKSRFNDEFDKKLGFETKSIICYPIHNREDKTIGAIEVLNKKNQDRFTVEDEKTMKVLALIFSSVFHSFNHISEHSMIRRFSTPFDREHALIGKSLHISSLRNAIIKTKDLDAPVLISGEVGVGKTLYSKILHYEGKRGLKPFEIIHCNGVDKDEFLKEILGTDHERSKFIKCMGGTILLADVGKIPLPFQKKIHEILSTRQIPDEQKVTLDVRVIATTSEDLGELVLSGKFYQPLFEMLNHIHITIEPLRRRMDDLELLVEYFLKVECKRQGFLLKGLGSNAMRKLSKYDWPGNVKELRLAIERAVSYNPKQHIIPDVEFSDSAIPLTDVSAKKRAYGDIPYIDNPDIPLKDRLILIEREMILEEIKRHGNNKSKAADELGISREALRKKLISAKESVERIEASFGHKQVSIVKKEAA